MPDTHPGSPSNKLQLALDATQQCVMCGMCSNHCPTYQIEQREHASPRGRIKLARELLKNGNLDATGVAHLDSCRLCFRCEQVCPSKVDYRKIIYQARTTRPDNRRKRLAKLFYMGPRSLTWRLVIARFLIRLPGGRTLFNRVANNIYGYNQLDTTIEQAQREEQAQRAPAALQANPIQKADASLFTGCVQSSLDPETTAAAITLLNGHGLAINIPQQQTCCGGLPAMLGDDAGKTHCHTQNQHAFSEQAAILHLGSGCARSIREFAAQPVYSVADFLIQKGLERSPGFISMPQQAVLHLACSQHRQPDAKAEATLLTQIPDLKLKVIESPQGCCGAGGDITRDDDTGVALGQNTLDALLASNPDIILSQNIACAVHLKKLLKQRKRDIPVLHPLTLLARQMKKESKQHE